MDRGDYIAGFIGADRAGYSEETQTDARVRSWVRSLPLDDFDALIAYRNKSNISSQLRDRIDRHLKDNFSETLTTRAIDLLHTKQPRMSALSPLASWQRGALISLPIAGVFGLLFAPTIATTAALCLVLIYCIASTTLKGVLMLVSLKADARTPAPQNPRTPIVTLLLPVHDEDKAIAVLVNELKKLDYPVDRLDIKFLTESDDAKTRNALDAMHLPPQFEVLVVPKSEPQTKPKAMNYALPFVRGEIVGIYDAEDAPEPDQVRKAVNALDAADPRTVCVQSRLNHYDATETFFSRMASLEYTLWFDMMLRGLSKLSLPVPLGGTSLFIQTTALRAVDGWDPSNVTEDADLGVRLARRGWRAEVIDSTTWEEPPVAFGQWAGQRSRWIKGFMVTWLVHMRDPKLLFSELGWKSALAINVMLLDGFVAFLLQPLFWAAIIATLFFGTSLWSSLLTPSVSSAIMWVFLAGHAFILAPTLVAVKRRFGLRRALWSPLLWVYWQCATYPAYRALWEMFGQQSTWKKTEHGLSKEARKRRENALGAPETACVPSAAPSEPRHVRTNSATENRNGQPWLPESPR